MLVPQDFSLIDQSYVSYNERDPLSTNQNAETDLRKTYNSILYLCVPF